MGGAVGQRLAVPPPAMSMSSACVLISSIWAYFIVARWTDMERLHNFSRVFHISETTVDRTPSARAIITQGPGGGKNWRFSTEIIVYLGKRCEIVRWLLWNVNRKSWVPD